MNFLILYGIISLNFTTSYNMVYYNLGECRTLYGVVAYKVSFSHFLIFQVKIVLESKSEDKVNLNNITQMFHRDDVSVFVKVKDIAVIKFKFMAEPEILSSDISPDGEKILAEQLFYQIDSCSDFIKIGSYYFNRNHISLIDIYKDEDGTGKVNRLVLKGDYQAFHFSASKFTQDIDDSVVDRYPELEFDLNGNLTYEELKALGD